MRGVVSAGMVAGLEHLGLLPAFDVIYGTSAGAINGAYFVAGRAAFGASIYYEEINNSQFMNPLRSVCGAPSMSLEFLFLVAQILASCSGRGIQTWWSPAPFKMSAVLESQHR